MGILATPSVRDVMLFSRYILGLINRHQILNASATRSSSRQVTFLWTNISEDVRARSLGGFNVMNSGHRLLVANSVCPWLAQAKFVPWQKASTAFLVPLVQASAAALALPSRFFPATSQPHRRSAQTAAQLDF